MTAKELRQKFLKYFESKGHKILPSASLIPENDPTVLFTTAGMHPLVPYLMGEKHPEGKRLCNLQKCLRTDDIDEVGDATHHTFFEMLGNWSLGDYWKEDAIKWSYEFLMKELGLKKDKFAVSCFAGDSDAPRDDGSAEIWKSLGVDENRIAFLTKEDNWWGPAGQTGPCGPDTEMFYWTGVEEAPTSFQETHDDPHWVEIWNDVFMQYNKTAEGKFEPLTQKNVDTGMGLERMAAVLSGVDDDYRTDLFWPIIEKIEELSGLEYGNKKDAEYIADGEQCWVDVRKDMRIIADHLKAAAFVMYDGTMPSNKDQGYVVRRLIRRAIVKAKNGPIAKANGKGIEGDFVTEIAKNIYDIYQADVFTDKEVFDAVMMEMAEEESKFNKALSQGLKEFDKQKSNLNGDVAFNLYQTYGFPLDMTVELARESGIEVDVKLYEQAFAKHQELSRTASAGRFKGGLSDNSEETTKLHTAAHLMLEALRCVLGDHVVQRGSNITAERLRFDFSHNEKMTPEQIAEVEKIVNEQIEKDLPVVMEEMTVEEAEIKGAMGAFKDRYGEKVKVYSIGEYSKEICGGPHVEHTSELGNFRIKKEESSSAGVRRIKALLKV